jgi:hypothetical protein
MRNLIRYRHIPEMNVVALINKQATTNAPTQDELRKLYLNAILDEVHSESGCDVSLCSCYSNYFSLGTWKGRNGVSLIVFPERIEAVNYEFSKKDFWRNPGSDPLRADYTADIKRISERGHIGHINGIFLFKEFPFGRDSYLVHNRYKDFYIDRLLGYRKGGGYP